VLLNIYEAYISLITGNIRKGISGTCYARQALNIATKGSQPPKSYIGIIEYNTRIGRWNIIFHILAILARPAARFSLGVTIKTGIYRNLQSVEERLNR
jgi:hypothetical protein